MAVTTIKDVGFAGISACVPSKIVHNSELGKIFGASDVDKIIKSTGVRQRHVVDSMCASDLCFASAVSLIEEAGIDREEIDGLIFVSQTPDYTLPATSCALHGRLGLSKKCVAFDINLGCSGYVYGVWVAANLIATGALSKVILLAGDTISKVSSPQDRSVALLFGDAGSATLLEKKAGRQLNFILGSDGSGAEKLMIPAGAFRQPLNNENTVRKVLADGNVRAESDLYMNGAEIFAFTLSVVPRLIKELVAMGETPLDDYDAVIMHQANKFMLDHLGKRIKLSPGKNIIGLEDFGNTSCASIPLTLVTKLRDQLINHDNKLIMTGFGVGLSWAAMSCHVDQLIVPELLVVDES